MFKVFYSFADHVPQATAERLEFRARQRQNNARVNTNECLKNESRNGFPFANSNNVRDKRLPLSQSRPTQLGLQGKMLFIKITSFGTMP